jgi:predicted nucleotidyltransferase
VSAASCRSKTHRPRTRIELGRAAIERFGAVVERDPLVVAAFVGGSFAAGTAREDSDVDVYVVAREDEYRALWDRRHALLREWGDPVFEQDVVNFEGLGFDMVLFEFVDTVDGEIAFGHTGNFMALHGGPYDVLVDKIGLLEGVEFPLL